MNFFMHLRGWATQKKDLIYWGARQKGKCAKIPDVFASVALRRDKFIKFITARARDGPDFTLR
jgi:hypothetical protein